MYLRERVIVLRCAPFSRTSLKLTLWGERRGLLVLTARGMMRPRNNRLGDVACEFDSGEAVYYARSGGQYTGGILTDFALHQSLAGRLNGSVSYAWLAALAAVREATCRLYGGFPTEAADTRPVYSALERLLESAGRAEPFWAAVAGVLALLRIAGLAPPLDACTVCGGALDAGSFSEHRQALLCDGCANTDAQNPGPNAHDSRLLVRLDAGILKYLRALAASGADSAAGLGMVSPARAAGISKFLSGWLRAATGSGIAALGLLAPAIARRAS